MLECGDFPLLPADAFAYERPRRDPPVSFAGPARPFHHAQSQRQPAGHRRVGRYRRRRVQLASLSVIITRGGRICLFSSLRSSRLADCLLRRRWTRTSSTTPAWSTARQSQCFTPVILSTT